MRIFSYAIVAFLVNYILYNTFPYGGGGSGMELFITISIISIITAMLTGIHYFLNRKGKSVKYFQISGNVLLVVVSYGLFITEPNNGPCDVIRRMSKIRREYDKIKITDYFLEPYYYNYEKIVAAKRKFSAQICDTVYSVRVYKVHSYNVIESYGISYSNGSPILTNNSVRVSRIANDTFKFQEIIEGDTIVYYGNNGFISQPVNISDSFRQSGAPYPVNTTIKTASTDIVVKAETPDKDYWAYKIFYWLL